MLVPDCDNESRFSEKHALVVLQSAGYISGMTDGEAQLYRWHPTTKGAIAVGHDILQEKTADVRTNDEGAEVAKFGRDSYRWTLVLGCREFNQIDATTQLKDGIKVDLSWHWKDTPLGEADGLSDERQRAVAYLTLTDGSLKTDRIQFDSER
jgi:hypothetical protein